MKIAKRAAVLSPSLTLALTAKAKAMKAEGKDVVSFGAGEPDFDTPDFVKDVAIEDIKNGVTKYTPVRGTPDLLGAIAEILKKDYGLEYTPQEIIVSLGGKHSLFNLMYALVDDGDEVIIPSPYWLTYPEQVKACGGKPVVVDCPPEAGFKITPEQLRSAITERTVAFVLNSPGNPTGAVYTAEELKALGAVLEEHPNVAIVSDDLYQKLVYPPTTFASLPALVPSLKARTIVVNGLSKAYSMTGWRLGWMAGPKEVISVVNNLQGQSTSNPVSFTQRAAAVALRSDHSFLGPWLEQFAKRRQTIVDGLKALPGVTCDPAPQGAFYAFPDVSALYGKSYEGKKIDGSMAFAEILLEKANVSVVPGIAFGEDRCVRLSYATSEDVIKKGLERIGEFLNKLS